MVFDTRLELVHVLFSTTRITWFGVQISTSTSVVLPQKKPGNEMVGVEKIVCFVP